MRNKIEEIFQDVFFTDVNRAANKHCDGCALTMEVEEAWATREGKSGLTKIMEACTAESRNRLNLPLKETCLKSSVHLCKIDTSAVYLLYMDFLRRDECYQLGCCEYM